MRSAKVLIIMVVALALAACGSDKKNNDQNPPPPGTSTFLASGGTGSTGTGGTGGELYIESYGSVKVLRSGTVDASFVVSAITPSFGTNPYVVSGGTITVLLDTDESGVLCTFYGDANLYIGDGDGNCDINDTMVTGLTIDAGSTLVLVDQGYCGGPSCGGYATMQLSNDLVINGTLTTDVHTVSGLYIEAKIIDVETSGIITSSATTTITGGNAGGIYLGYGSGKTKQIINNGTIEAKGVDSGSGGSLYMNPAELVVNYGMLDTSGGSGATSGGSAGWVQVYVDDGNFYSSGTVRMNGGDGGAGNGGDSNNNAWIETAYNGITYGNGDIIISGTWEANGGNGTNGNGGSGGFWGFVTDAMGAVTINATMSAKGGNGTGVGSIGGSSNGIYIDSENYDSVDPVTPGKIRIAGQYDLRGGNGDQDGGSGGYIEIFSYGFNFSNIGSNVELVGFPALIMNGGDGAMNGGSASGWAFEIYTYSAGNPTPPITNEAAVQAKGGNAGNGGTGGSGGYVDLWTENDTVDVNTVINNSGNIDVSGGNGDYGGNGYYIYLQAERVTNSGNLTARGGDGSTAIGSGGSGGSGGNITLTSNTATSTNAGTLRVAGGIAEAAGGDGFISIDGTSGPI